jgi:hypothetical protein
MGLVPDEDGRIVLLQNCDGRDKSEPARQACREYEQHFAIVYNSVGCQPASEALLLVPSRNSAESQ